MSFHLDGTTEAVQQEINEHIGSVLGYVPPPREEMDKVVDLTIYDRLVTIVLPEFDENFKFINMIELALLLNDHIDSSCHFLYDGDQHLSFFACDGYFEPVEIDNTINMFMNSHGGNFVRPRYIIGEISNSPSF